MSLEERSAADIMAVASMVLAVPNDLALRL